MYIKGCLRVKIKSVLNLHCGSPPLVCMCTQHQVHYHKLHYTTVEIQIPGKLLFQSIGQSGRPR